MSQHNSNYVRRVVLPSGRAIEVVYFENQTAADAPLVPARREAVDLHLCPECDKGLVYPVEWEEASSTHWEVELRCPNCEWETVGLYDQDTVDRFDEELDRGVESVLEDLQAMTRANMEEQIDTFVAALQADLILPEDF
jgi:hypothetical protein